MSKRNSLKVGDPLPEVLGHCADFYKQVRDLRLAMDKEVKAIKDRETEIYNHIVDNLSVEENTGVAGRKYRAQITTQEEPTVTDWENLYDYIHENDRFDLLNKSLAKKAVKDMLEEGDKIPGVDTIIVKKVSITKILEPAMRRKNRQIKMLIDIPTIYATEEDFMEDFMERLDDAHWRMMFGPDTDPVSIAIAKVVLGELEIEPEE